MTDYMTDYIRELSSINAIVGPSHKKETELERLRAMLERLRAIIKKLKGELKFLQYLRDAGVDNWEGYEEACALESEAEVVRYDSNGKPRFRK